MRTSKTYSVTFGLPNDSKVITFWDEHTRVRLVPLVDWLPLDSYDFEDYTGGSERFQFKTTVVWESDGEQEDEPWKQSSVDEEDEGIKERPCTWTICMASVPWVRTIHRTEEEQR